MAVTVFAADNGWRIRGGPGGWYPSRDAAVAAARAAGERDINVQGDTGPTMRAQPMAPAVPAAPQAPAVPLVLQQAGTAADGQTFAGQPANVQQAFRSAWGDSAPARWAWEHNQAIGQGGGTVNEAQRFTVPGSPPSLHTTVQGGALASAPASVPAAPATGAATPAAAAPPAAGANGAATTAMPAWFQDWLTNQGQQYATSQQQYQDMIKNQAAQYGTQQQQMQQLISGQATANDLTAQNMKLMGGTEFAKIWIQAATLAADTAYRSKLLASNDVNAARTAGIESARITLEDLARQRGMDITQAKDQVQAEIARGTLNLDQERQKFLESSEQQKIDFSRQMGMGDLAFKREQLAQQGALGWAAQHLEAQKLAQQGGFQQGQLGLEQAKFLAGLRGPADAFTYMNMFRGQQPGQYPAFLNSIQNNQPMPSFGGATPGPGGPLLRDVFSQVLNIQPQNDLELQNKQIMLQALTDQQRVETEHAIGTGQLGVSAAQVDVQRQAMMGGAGAPGGGPGGGGTPGAGGQEAQPTPQQLGFRAPPAGAMVSQAEQTFSNPTTGQTVTTPTGGYVPPPGWVRGGLGGLGQGQPAATGQTAPVGGGGGMVLGMGGGGSAFMRPGGPQNGQAPQVNLTGALPPTLAAQQATLTNLGVTAQPRPVQPAGNVPTPTGPAPSAPPRRFFYYGGGYYEVDNSGGVNFGDPPLSSLPADGVVVQADSFSPGGSYYQRIISPDKVQQWQQQQTAYNQYQNNLRVPLANITPTVPQNWQFGNIPTITPQMVTPQILNRFSPSEQAALGNLVQEQGKYTVPDWLAANKAAFSGFSAGNVPFASPYQPTARI